MLHQTVINIIGHRHIIVLNDFVQINMAEKFI